MTDQDQRGGRTERTTTTRSRVEVVDLGKSYGEVTALTGVNLRVAAGTVVAVLGHNGAGKTTLVDILATRITPSTGTATVCGFDVRKSGHEVRRRIALTGQTAAVDQTLSGRGNLVLVARLLGAPARAARARADELIDVFDLADAADRLALTYSGGMRRRLDLAACLVGAPQVLFLDEPTTGLDPVSRTGLWATVRHLAREGTTVVLTTQYLEEADQLADRIVVLAGGAVVAQGTPPELKAHVGARTATVTFPDTFSAQWAVDEFRRLGLTPTLVARTVRAPVPTAALVVSLVRALDRYGLAILDLTITEPTLDEVYLALHNTGWAAWGTGATP
ncbi:ATP-binding cassette domain-containing protein [Actinokineospora diospyrosa]|uniref:ABC-2 type transport system ATP-binding protein n=1 Tax=Actinokineospora diospyrosa TaxID=103728 RepID=A0ABT1IBQ3_9PSEU|nr:ATP-binding cassette domain-containing protein [Actinokineospora diospyrosa]MCP2270069.1 ABC-2 type transport system ATP-binding protein [Actinokineospora diospyrosa]